MPISTAKKVGIRMKQCRGTWFLIRLASKLKLKGLVKFLASVLPLGKMYINGKLYRTYKLDRKKLSKN